MFHIISMKYILTVFAWKKKKYIYIYMFNMRLNKKYYKPKRTNISLLPSSESKIFS